MEKKYYWVCGVNTNDWSFYNEVWTGHPLAVLKKYPDMTIINWKEITEMEYIQYCK